MEQKEIEPIVEQLETITNTLNKTGFKLEGLRDEVENWESKMPKVFARRIDVNKRKINRLIKESGELSVEKERLEAIVGSYRLELEAKKAEENKIAAEKEALAVEKKRIAAEKRKATIARKKAEKNV